MKDKKRFIPKGRAEIITVVCLLVEIMILMPMLISKIAGLVNSKSASLPGLWAVIDLLVINIIWILTWLLTYRFAHRYITVVLKTRNVKMILLVIGTIYTLETVINNNHALVAVFSIIAYLSLWAWFDYVFAHPVESNELIDKTDHFIREHKHLNRGEVQDLIHKNNHEVIDWLETHLNDNQERKDKH